MKIIDILKDEKLSLSFEVFPPKNDPKFANKPEQMLQNIVKGKVNKTLAEICLVEQPFVKDPSLTVGNYVKANGAEIVKVVRYGVGEGIQKKTENFAEEVAKQMK